MSPLIEEARRRQRRRRVLLGALLVVAATAALVGFLHRGTSSERQAQPKPALVITSAPGGAVIQLHPGNSPSGEPATVLRTLVNRLGQPKLVTYSVQVDPKTGAVKLITTPSRP